MERIVDRMMAAMLRGTLEVVGRLPADFARVFCATLARGYAVLGGPRVDDARTNLALAFPEVSQSARQKILIASFANLGRSFAELARMVAASDRAGFERVRIEGREHLEALERARGKGGALVVTAHFGSWEFCAAALAHHGLPVSVVQHPRRNVEVDRVVNGWREANGLETLSIGRAALGVFRALGRGRYVALLLDQNASEEEGIYAPFFGTPACTRSGPAQLAMTRDAPVVPVFFFREGTSGNHTARIGAPIEVEPEGEAPDKALAVNVERMNAAIEAAIRQAPEQWIWTHRRFKTRPRGAASIYPPRRGLLRRFRHALRGAR
ncbi:MAG: lysophospholipid acyltransferase family protein [Myxococcota bacterium]|nr:lysophospholipid acyltransferase family protein [Myxococcota bacterium]